VKIRVGIVMQLDRLVAPICGALALSAGFALVPASPPGQGSIRAAAAVTERAFVPARPDGVTARAVAAARDLLEALEDTQRAAAVFERDDAVQRTRWSNLPSGIFERRGLRMQDLGEPLRRKVLALLGVVLSEPGLQQVLDNMFADGQLPAPPPERGVTFGEHEFFLAFIGAPSLVEPWMIQFGGHHLGLNITVLGERIVLAPCLTGGQPMHFRQGERDVVQMAEELDLAYGLLESLDEAQRARAVRADVHIDLTWGPGRERPEDVAALPVPEGLPASAMDVEQRARLLRLVRARIGLLNDEDAAVRMAELEAELSRSTFAWFGSTARDGVATYRVQGPSLFMEFAPQGRGAGAREHVHALYRDPTNEYGRGLARAPSDLGPTHK